MTRRFALLVLLLGSGLPTAADGITPPADTAGPRASRHDRANGGDLPLRVAAAVYKGTNAHAVLLVVDIDARAVFDHDGGAGHLRIEYVVTDESGQERSAGRAYDGTPALDQGGRARATRDGLRALTWLDLPHGRYNVRVAARTGGRTGTAVHRLEVPDFGARLTMSSAVLSTAADGAVVIASGAAAPIDLPVPPTARREFQAGEWLVLFTEVYESDARLRQFPRRADSSSPVHGPAGDHTTHVTAQLQTRDGSILLLRTGTRSMEPSRAGRHAFVTSVPLEGVPPGRYVLQMKARANINGPDSAVEEIPIRVK